jgi:hypothetical protein
MCQTPLLRIHLHQRRAKPESGPFSPKRADREESRDAFAEPAMDRARTVVANEKRRGEGLADACVDDVSPEQRFMAATKDVRPDEPIDMERAIALLVHHGFPDNQIHAIIARCERSAAQSACARRLMTKIDNLVDRQARLRKDREVAEGRILREQREKEASPLSSQQALGDSCEKAREGSGKTWLTALAVVAGGVVAAVAA